MPYTTLTLAQALTDLGRRLNDPDSVFWSVEEKIFYIQEAIQTFNAYANFFRETFPLDLVPDQTWYDITDAALYPDTLRAQNTTDVDIYTEIQYHLLEPPTGASWTGSRQFTIDDLVMAVQHRRDQLLYDAGYQTSRIVLPATDYNTELPQTKIDVRRVAWLPNTSQTDYLPRPLFRDDQWGINSFVRNRVPEFGEPTTYRLSTDPPLRFTVDFKPIVTGDYEILTISSGAVLSASNPTVLVVPNDLSWVIKFGALADLLNRESVARDPMRAEYCEHRYRQGMTLLRTAPALLNAEIDYTTIDIDAVQSGDEYNISWQAQPPTAPSMVYTTGLNLIAVAPPPDQAYELDLTVVRNAPIPTAADDYLQVGREDYDAILDYAQHIAAFKQGGAEFMMTMPLLNNFIRHCKIYNSKLTELGEFTDVTYDQSQNQLKYYPILASITEGAE